MTLFDKYEEECTVNQETLVANAVVHAEFPHIPSLVAWDVLRTALNETKYHVMNAHTGLLRALVDDMNGSRGAGV